MAVSFDPLTLASWDATYAQDITTNTETPSHTGQDWFSDQNASSKVLDYLVSSALKLDLQTTSFLDVGAGNGEMLFVLREEGGFEGRMVGVDYSDASIQLGKKRLASIQEDGGADIGGIAFEEWDVMHSVPREAWQDGFDVVLDKGTFDAISLSDEADEAGRRICEGYREKVEVLVKPGGYLVVTSCNWNEEELKGWFGGGQLEVFGRIEYPVFRFGGQTGQSVSTLCFRKRC